MTFILIIQDRSFIPMGGKQQRGVGSMGLWELSHEFSNINLKLKSKESIGHVSKIHLDNMGDFVLSHIVTQEVL
jgi:hypothetical protein